MVALVTQLDRGKCVAGSSPVKGIAGSYTKHMCLKQHLLSASLEALNDCTNTEINFTDSEKRTN